MTELKSIERLRKSLNDCTTTAGVEPNRFDTYWITARACDMLIDEIEREVSERFIELPVDADGVPIRVGDAVAEKPFRPGIGEKPANVVCMLINSDGWAIGDCDPRGHWFHPATLEHIKPRTIEDVVKQAVANALKMQAQCMEQGQAITIEDAVRDDYQEFVGQFCADIREMAKEGEL